MLQLYGYPNTRSTRATWALEEAGAEYLFIPIRLAAGDHKRDDFLKISPFAKIPVLIDSDGISPALILTESAAICTHIGERFPASGLVPSIEHPASRAEYFQWCFFAVSELEPHLWTAARHTRLLPDERKVPAVAATCAWEFSRAGAILSMHLTTHEYLAGEAFTAADILCVTMLHWADHQKFELNPILTDYVERLSQRPALIQARQREADAALHTQ